MYVDDAILQLKWLNQELTKIWPFVNDVRFLATELQILDSTLSLFDLTSIMYNLIVYAFFYLTFVIAGGIRTDQNLCRACS